MAQTSYSSAPAPGIPGQIGDTGPRRTASKVNLNATPQPYGIFMAESTGTYASGADVLAAATDRLAGIVLKSDAHAVDGLTGTQAVDTKEVFDVLAFGSAWVRSEQTMVPGDPVYVRFATGAGTQIGAIRKTNDTGTCRLVQGARVIRNGTSALGVSMALIHYDKSVDEGTPDLIEMSYPFAQCTATTTYKVGMIRADRHFVLDEAWVEIITTGVTQDGSNGYALAVKLAALVAATYDTKVTAITADTFTQFANGTLANRTGVPGAEIDLVATLTGTKTLPAGMLHIKGHYV